jgi:dolichyl-phosphate beta-glucosyltransferase
MALEREPWRHVLQLGSERVAGRRTGQGPIDGVPVGVARVAVRASERTADVRIDRPVPHPGRCRAVQQSTRPRRVVANVLLLAYSRQYNRLSRRIFEQQRLLDRNSRGALARRHAEINRTATERATRVAFAAFGDSSSSVGGAARSVPNAPFVVTVTPAHPAPRVPHTVVVVPCYNEARRLDARAFATFRSTGHWVEFLFVNDGSTDDTREVLERIRCASPDTVRVLDLPRNQGKAEAVRAGMLAALETDAEFVGFWDADLATPLEALPRFLDTLDERPSVDAVLGSRVKLLGRTIERYAWRHYLGRVFATLVSQLLRLAVYDTQCGAKVFRTNATLRTVLVDPFRTSWLFDVEILARMIAASPTGTAGVAVRLYELPLDEWRDVAGSKLTRAAYVRAATSLFAVYRLYGRMLSRQSRV